MSFVDEAAGELNLKIVYYGPGLAGKTTNIRHIHDQGAALLGDADDDRGRLISVATETDRTLLFNFKPQGLPRIDGHAVRVHLYTVPGPVFFDSTRLLVLKGADAVIFVADSQRVRHDANIESMAQLMTNLAVHGEDPDRFPLVLQYNKRDLPTALPLEELERDLNPGGSPSFPAVAYKGQGVMETIEATCELLLASRGATGTRIADTAGGGTGPGVPEAPRAPDPRPGFRGWLDRWRSKT